MAVLKKYNLAGEEIGQVEIQDDLLACPANSQMIKDYLVALRGNARQWSASTKNRAEVNHSGKKPHPQKGTGRARQGYLGSPQYKGGGRVHTPRPKFDQHVSINKKERRAAIRHLLIEKIQGNRVHVLQFSEIAEPKTSQVAKFLNALSITGKRVLFLGEGFVLGGGLESVQLEPREKFGNLVLSMRNIPRTKFMLMSNISGYDVIVNSDLIVVEAAVDQLKVLLGRKAS